MGEARVEPRGALLWQAVSTIGCQIGAWFGSAFRGVEGCHVKDGRSMAVLVWAFSVIT